MQIDVLCAGPIETNAYLLNSGTGESLLVDAPPGVEQAVRERVGASGSRLAGVLLTHGHWDHIGDLGKFAGVTVYAHPGDRDWIENPEQMAAFMPPGLEVAPGRVDRWLEDGETLELAGEKIEVRWVPGHAPGSVLYYFAGLGAAFSGDALFRGGVGRFDLPGGDWNALERSIRGNIFSLPPDTAVYPGHGPATTVAEEMRSNPFVGTGAAR